MIVKRVSLTCGWQVSVKLKLWSGSESGLFIHPDGSGSATLIGENLIRNLHLEEPPLAKGVQGKQHTGEGGWILLVVINIQCFTIDNIDAYGGDILKKKIAI